MLRDALIFSAIAVLGAVYFAGGHFSELTQAVTEKPSAASLDTREPTATRSVRLRGDRSGHFFGDFTINGRKVKAVIDTGASAVAINRSTAKRAGISVTPADFTYRVSTANGDTYAARVMLDKVELGRIQVRNVPAVVLDDSALGMTLIGMTFLRETRFSIADNTLSMTQR